MGRGERSWPRCTISSRFAGIFRALLLLAREPIAFGPTESALSARNLLQARQLCEAWDEDAEACRRGEHAVQTGFSKESAA